MRCFVRPSRSPDALRSKVAAYAADARDMLVHPTARIGAGVAVPAGPNRIAEKPSNVVALVTSNPPAVSIIEFAASALTRKPGAMVEFDDFYLAYWEHCETIGGRAVAPAEAVEQTNKLCAECGIRIQRRGKKRFLAGVRLIKSTSNSQRLEPDAAERKNA